MVEPGAALVNMEKLRNDKTDLGLSMTTVTADARAGVNSWKGKQTDEGAQVFRRLLEAPPTEYAKALLLP